MSILVVDSTAGCKMCISGKSSLTPTCLHVAVVILRLAHSGVGLRTSILVMSAVGCRLFIPDESFMCSLCQVVVDWPHPLQNSPFILASVFAG